MKSQESALYFFMKKGLSLYPNSDKARALLRISHGIHRVGDSLHSHGAFTALTMHALHFHGIHTAVLVC